MGSKKASKGSRELDRMLAGGQDLTILDAVRLAFALGGSFTMTFSPRPPPPPTPPKVPKESK